MILKAQLLIFAFIPLIVCTQSISPDSAFLSVPLKDGEIVYEKVFYVDSVNNKDLVFNAAKSALIRNTNYKYTKVDEDRTAGNISAQITFEFVGKPGIAKLVFTGTCLMSIDIKENRFRVRLLNNASSVYVMNILVEYIMKTCYLAETEQREKKKWKSSKSMILDWHEKLSKILNAFGLIIKERVVNDDF